MNISDIQFSVEAQHNKPISAKKYLQIIEYFNRQLVIGAELERDIPVDRSSLQRSLGCGRGQNRDRDLKASPSNKYNVAYIDSDGTVQSGNEIIFAGTNETFDWIHKKMKLLETKLDQLNARPYVYNGSTHISLLTIQDKVLPAIILKNIWNLSRAFSSSLFWLTSGDNTQYFRSEGANHYARARLGNSVVREAMNWFLQNHATKYSLCNISKNRMMVVLPNRDAVHNMAGLYVEFRQPDCIRVPSALTSLFFLHRALVYKAVDLSRKGCSLVESLDQWTENKRVSNNIADIHSFRDTEKTFCQEQSHRLLDFLEPELKQMSPEALRILRILADTPVSAIARDLNANSDWHNQVEKKLCKRKVSHHSEREEKVISEILDATIKQPSATKWKKKLSTKLRIPVRTIEYIIMNIETKRGVKAVFDKDLKTYTLGKR